MKVAVLEVRVTVVQPAPLPSSSNFVLPPVTHDPSSPPLSTELHPHNPVHKTPHVIRRHASVVVVPDMVVLVCVVADVSVVRVFVDIVVEQSP
jgi:hypothetical protein